MRLRGPVSNRIPGTSFDLLGVTVLTGVGGPTFTAADGVTPLSEAEFYAAITDGTIVDIDNATFTPGPGELDSGDITIED